MESSQTAEFVYNNILKIVDQSGDFYGTGFSFEENRRPYILTCHHCIYKLNKIFVEKKGIRHPCEWIEEYSEMNKDIAVLSSDSKLVSPLQKNRQAMPMLGVFVWGFSITKLNTFQDGSPVEDGKLSEVAFRFHWDEENIVATKEWNKKPAVDVFGFQFAGKFDRGFSGAPVCYSGDKKVIGMFTAKDNEYGYVIPIETILARFESKGISQPSVAKNANKLLEMGNKLYLERKFSDSVLQYDLIIKDSNYLSALTNKGRSLAQLGKNKEAIELFDVVLAIDPNFIYALNGMGLALAKLGQNNAAIEWFDKALKINPNDIDVLNNKGSALAQLGMNNAAIEWFDKALKINPNDIDVLNNRGEALARMGEDKDAIEWFDKVLEIDPGNANALHMIGVAHWFLGDTDMANFYYDKVLAIAPNFHRTIYNKACNFAHVGDVQNALKYLHNAIRLDERYRNWALKEKAFINIRRNPDFERIVGLNR